MLAQKKVSKKKNMVLGIVTLVLFVIAGIFVYLTYFSSPDIDIAGAGILSAPRASITTKFDTELFDDPRIKSLKQYGPADVLVEQRGRSTDPFQPF